MTNTAMIQLTEKVIAVEVPKGSKSIFVSHWPKSNPEIMYLTRKDNPVSVKLTYGIKYSLVGVTPLSEKQWKEVVYGMEIQERDMKLKPVGDPVLEYLDYRNKFGVPMLKTATESGLSLLESKGLDINKKYAIIKIEK